MYISHSAQNNNMLIRNWYDKYQDNLMGFIGKSTKQLADLQDISQEIYLRMLRVKNPELIIYPKAYLFKIATHVLDEWRNNNQNKNAHVENDDANNLDQSNKYLFSIEGISSNQIDINKALADIPKKYSATIIMKWRYGKTYKEISTDFEITERQVKRYIIKGYAALRLKLQNII